MTFRELFQFLGFLFLWLFFQSFSVASPSQPIKTSETLPTYLPKNLYREHVANELGWVPSTNPKDTCGGYYVEPSIVSRYPHPGSFKQEPAIITAKGPSTIMSNGMSFLQQQVVVTQPGRIVEADKAYIYRDGKTGHITKIRLVGHVKLREAGKLIVADEGSVTLYPKTAVLVNTAYHIYSEHDLNHSIKGPFHAWGTATHAVRDENEVITLNDASYSTCVPTHPSWQLRGTKIILDKPHHRGKAYNGRIRFKGIPIFYLPYYSFPLDHQRKTGFLTPRIGYMSRSGWDFAFPFYWNLAPNYDLTITPEYLTLRNYELTTNFRFLSKNSHGYIYANFLPNDTQFQNFRTSTFNTFSNTEIYNQTFFQPYLNQLNTFSDARGFFSMYDATRFNAEWQAHVDLNYVIDPYFFQDLGGFMNADSQSNQLLNRLDLEYSGLHWDFTGLAQIYETLHIINQTQNPALDQYQRVPDFELNGYYPYVDHDIDLILNNELVNFSYQSDFNPDFPIGQRLHLRPGLSFPINFASGYFKPEIWSDMTAYNIEHLQPGQVSSADRILPIADIDLGLYFDRYFTMGQNSYIQTLEPRIFYLWIPYQNQDNLPNFDTLLLPFYFEQLYALNAFTGDDRLQNANQISLGLTSRIISTTSGASILTGNVGFIYYIDNARVCLSSGCAQPEHRFSPLISELIFSPDHSHWSLNGKIAWDPNVYQTNNASFGLNYNRDGYHIFSTSYVFVHENGASIVPTVLFSPDNVYSTNTSLYTTALAWPLVKQWSTVGYWVYNITRRRTDTVFGGLQYDTCCWAMRAVVQRSYAGSTLTPSGGVENSFNTAYFIQLQLKGLGDFGTTDMNRILSNAIPGFPT